MSGWVYMIIGVSLAIVGNYFVKMSNGFEHLTYGIVGIICAMLIGIFWTMAMKTLPLAATYMIWSGSVAVGFALLSHFVFGEAITLQKAALMVIILVAVVLLAISTEKG